MNSTAAINSQIQNISNDILHHRQAGDLERFTANLSDKELGEIDAVAQEFESVFLSQMLRPMFKELRTDGQFGGGHAEEIFRGLLIDEIGKKFSASGGVGISDVVRKELIELQSSIIKQPSIGGKITDPNSQKDVSQQVKAYQQNGEGVR